jgi:hypothetical protein
MIEPNVSKPIGIIAQFRLMTKKDILIYYFFKYLIIFEYNNLYIIFINNIYHIFYIQDIKYTINYILYLKYYILMYYKKHA